MSGGTFGQIFRADVDGEVYAQPLVVGGKVLIATETNWIYALDHVTGSKLWSRNVGAPWNSADLGCADLGPSVGIKGTPVVDPATNTEYFFSKTYDSGAAAWFAHAVDIANGNERPGFPVKIQGSAQNSSTTPFDAKHELQRPGLLLMNGVIYAGFGSICDSWPFHGWVVGVSTSGQIRAMWTSPPGSVSGAGIWQSGGGIVSDGPGQLIFATGNGGVPPSPTPGKSPPAFLGQSVVRLAVQGDGTLKATDFFAPYDAAQLDTWDGDLGSGSPVELPSPYFGTAQIPRLIVQEGKQGYIYLLNADDLGGIGNGPNGADAVVTRIGPYSEGVWAKPAVWPGDGGYIYMPFAFGPVRAFKYGLDGSGKPTLAYAGATPGTFGFGSSAGVVTSSGTTSGSALLWTVWRATTRDGASELRAYDAVPTGGTLNLRFAAPVGQGTKFSLPGIGDSRVYVGTLDGHVLGFGYPASVPLSGQPLSFPATPVGSSSTLTETLTATGPVTVTGFSSSDVVFKTGTPSRSLPATLANGDTISVPVTFTPPSGGTFGASLNVATTSGTLGVGLSGSGQTSSAAIESAPPTLSFGGAPVGSQKTSTVTFTNTGGQPLTITGTHAPAPPFSASGMPGIGSQLAAGQSVTTTVTFSPTETGMFTGTVGVTTDVGDAFTQMSGTATDPGKLEITPTTISYGNVDVGSSATQSFTVANTGASPVTITKSKPPFLGAFTATTTLSEGTIIQPGTTLTETVTFSPTTAGPAADQWQITGDDGSGPQAVTFNGTGVQTASTMTFTIAAGADDGHVERGDGGYPPAAQTAAVPTSNWTGILVRRTKIGYPYQPVTVGLLRFDTSGLPNNANVTGATLRLRVLMKNDAEGRNVVGEWYAASNWPVDATDWTLGEANTAIAGTPLRNLVVGQANDLNLQNLGSISLTGSIGLRLAISGASTPPTGSNEFSFAALEQGTQPAAQLIVTYSYASPPTNTSPPTIAGSVQAGQTLTASPGTWTGATPITYSYKWTSCDANGASCADTGATGPSYLVTNADGGKTLRVVVTATNSAGTSGATSPASGAMTSGPVSGADDGDVGVRSSTYPPSGSPAPYSTGAYFTVGRRFVYGGYEAIAGLVRFDTSGLPDTATVASATLRFFAPGRGSADNRKIVAEWYNASSWPIDAADWTLASTASALDGFDVAQIRPQASNDVPLSNGDGVSKTGYTGLRLHLDGGQPSGDNYVQVSSFESTKREALIVGYTVP